MAKRQKDKSDKSNKTAIPQNFNSTEKLNDLGNVLSSQTVPHVLITCESGQTHCHMSGDPVLRLGMLRVIERLIFKEMKGLGCGT